MSSEAITRNDLMAILNEVLPPKGYTGWDANINITSYTSSSDPYIAPKDGMVRLTCYYTNGNYIAVNIMNKEGTYIGFQLKATGSAYVMLPIPVFKGQKMYVSANNGSSNTAVFIGYST